MKAITSLDHLKKLASGEEQLECCIMLNGGARSSKTITYDPIEDGKLGVRWFIFNFIDDSEEEFENDHAFKSGYPLFFEAMKKGALFYFD